MAPAIAALFGAIVKAFPQIGVFGLVAQQMLVASGVMGPAIGASATPVGQSVAAGFGGLIVSHLVSTLTTALTSFGQHNQGGSS